MLRTAIDSGTLSAEDLASAKASQLFWAQQAAQQGTQVAGPGQVTAPPTISELAPKGAPWPFDVFLDAFKDFAKLLGDALQTIWQGFVTVISAIADWLKKNLLDPLLKLVMSLLEKFGDVISSAMGVVFKAVTTMVHPGSPLDPTFALPMLGVVAASMIAIQTTFIGVNVAYPLKDIIGPTTNAMVVEFLGFNKIAGAFWGALGAEVLEYPLRLWARMTFRARTPDHRLADEMYWHGELTGDEWHKLHTYEGWPDETIAKHGRSQYREPSVREIGMIMDSGGMSIEEIEATLRHRGTEPELAKVLAGAISRRPIADELRSLRSELIKQTAEGDMTTGELDSALRVFGVTEEEISLIMRIVVMRIQRLGRLQETKDLKAYQAEVVTASTEAFRRDLMDEGQYLEELLAAGLEDRKAAQRVYLEDVRKIPKPKRTISTGAAPV